MTEDEDRVIAEAWPARWAKANDPRPGASKRRNNLRKMWRGNCALIEFKEEHPDAKCENCANSKVDSTVGIKGRCCLLDSDFHGYQMVRDGYVCVLWSAR